VEEGLSFGVKFKTRAGGQGGVVVAGTSLGPTRVELARGNGDAWWATDGWGAVGRAELKVDLSSRQVLERGCGRRRVLDGTTSVSA
jgi:hypothetical protein